LPGPEQFARPAGEEPLLLPKPIEESLEVAPAFVSPCFYRWFAGYPAAMIPSTSLIPIHDENPTRTFSVLTLGLIIANVLVFLVTPGFGMTESTELIKFLYNWGLVPWEITHQHLTSVMLTISDSRLSLGQCPGVCTPDKTIYLSVFTSMFVHGGLLHIGGNMLFLWVFGNNIEDTVGKFWFLPFYLATGVAAALAHVVVNSESVLPTVGASGAIAGLLGAYIVLFPRAQVVSVPLIFILTTVRLPAAVVLGIWFISQFFIGTGQQAGSGVAWMAHVGGFVAGALLILPFRFRARSQGPAQYLG
jgi:membrane associated rhomboid family serine protease